MLNLDVYRLCWSAVEDKMEHACSCVEDGAPSLVKSCTRKERGIQYSQTQQEEGQGLYSSQYEQAEVEEDPLESKKRLVQPLVEISASLLVMAHGRER